MGGGMMISISLLLTGELSDAELTVDTHSINCFIIAISKYFRAIITLSCRTNPREIFKAEIRAFGLF